MGKNAEINQTASSDVLRYYLHEIGQHPLLTKEQEVEIAQTYRAGVDASEQMESILTESKSDVTHVEYAELGLVALIGHKIYGEAIAAGKDAKESMINSNLRLTVSIAKRYQHNGVELLDLIQEGNIGLDRAVEMFDPNKGFKFSTYATWWIRQGITRAIANQGTTIRVPVHMTDSLSKLRGVERLVEDKLGYVDDAVVCETLEISPDKLKQWRSYQRQSNPVSLNETIGEDGSAEYGDMVADKVSEVHFQKSSQQVVFEKLWENVVLNNILDEREQKVVILRFGLFGNEPHTLEEVGKQFNLTRERIRQIEKISLKKLGDSNRGFSVQDFAS